MKSTWIIIATIGCLARGFSAPPASAAAAPPPKKSADGLELPTAIPERKFHVIFPYAGQILGERPEEVGRVFNSKRSAALLAKHTGEDLGCDWFVINAAGADLAGLGLSDGRVTKLVLFYEVATPMKVSNIRKQIESKNDRAVHAALKTIGDDKKQSLVVTFDVDPVEFYLAYHPIADSVAAALRQHVWDPAMTDEQALLIGDGPGKYQATFAPDSATGDAKTGSVLFNDASQADIRMVFDARNKEDARQQALKKHKNLKDLKKMADPPVDGPKGDAGK